MNSWARTDLFSDSKLLDDSDIRLLQAYALKVEDNLTNSTFSKLKYLVPEADMVTLKQIEARIQGLSGFKPVRYDCYPRSCISYTRNHENATECPKCKTPRYKADGKTP